MIEDEGKSDQEKLANVLEQYKERKVMIGRAALENCSLEHAEINECMNNGSWTKRMSLCRAENRAFERCYVMQSVCFALLPSLSALQVHHGSPVASSSGTSICMIPRSN